VRSPQDGSTLLATKHHEAYCQFYDPGFLLNTVKNDIFLSRIRVFRGDKLSHKKTQFQSLLLIFTPLCGFVFDYCAVCPLQHQCNELRI